MGYERGMTFICKSPLAQSEEVHAHHPREAARIYAQTNCLDDTIVEVVGQNIVGGGMVNTYSVYARHTIVYDLTFLSSQEL